MRDAVRPAGREGRRDGLGRVAEDGVEVGEDADLAVWTQLGEIVRGVQRKLVLAYLADDDLGGGRVGVDDQLRGALRAHANVAEEEVRLARR